MSNSARIRIEQVGAVRCVTLCRGRGNALDLQALEELAEAFAVDSAPAPPVVLGAQPGVFCTGLDLHQAGELDRPAMGSLMLAFHRALTACFSYPAPLVAAIGGHALAGGALLALTCDVRLIADAPLQFGIHGIHLGVAYPDVAIEVLRATLSTRQIEALLYRGHRLDPVEAAELDLVDEPLLAAHLAEAAHRRAAELADLPQDAYAATKRAVRGGAIERLRALGEAGVESPGAAAWLDVWFTPATQARVQAAREGLRRGM